MNKNIHKQQKKWQPWRSARILVEEDYLVEPKVYFKGGADIYTQIYRQGETVTIPGSKVQANGWGNLVFVQYAQGNYIRIISPYPGDELTAFAEDRYCEMAQTHRRWRVGRTGNGLKR